MTTTRRAAAVRSRRLIAAIVLSSLIAAACGNSDDDEGGTDTTAAAETTVAADTTESPTTVAADTTPPTDTAAPSTDPGVTTTEAATPATDTTEPAGPDLGEFQPIEGVPGVTDDAIGFAVMGTGPINPLGYCLLECYEGGVQAYFDWRNSLGGVHGRELTIARTDDDEMGNTQVKMLEIADDDSVFGVFAAPLQPIGLEAAADAGMPLYTTFPSSTALVDVESSFVPGGIACTDCSNPMDVFLASLAGKSKVAGLGFGVSQASKECVDYAQADVEKYGPAVGVEWVYKNNELPFGLPNGLGPEVTAMKDAGVDYVVLCVDQNSALVLAQEFERQGMDDAVIVLPQGYGDSAFIEENADLLDGHLLGTAFRPFEADPEDTMTPTMQEWLAEAGVLPNDYAIQGWLGADLAVTGLLAAGPQFDRAGVIDATNALTDYDAGGIMPPMDWATGHQKPGQDGAPFTFCQSFVQVADGGITMFSDPASPFYCYEGPTDTYVEPVPFG